MSVPGRVEYHDFVRKSKQSGDHIPIIQSHTAITGRFSMRKLDKYFKDNNTWRFKPLDNKVVAGKRPFNPMPLNLFDDEIREIIKSDGLIGIMLDEKRTMGKDLPADIKNIKIHQPEGDRIKVTLASNVNFHLNTLPNYKRAQRHLGHFLFKQKYPEKRLKKSLIKRDCKDQNDEMKMVQCQIDHLREKMKPVTASIFINQLLHVAKVQGNVKVWDHLCIGSDYDGVINAIDTYTDASKLDTFGKDLIAYWKFQLNRNSRRYTRLTYGLTVEKIIQKVLWDNSMAFMQKYFTDDYRVKGIDPNP